MSFIRCLNNPDGAYVWHDVNGFVRFTNLGGTGKPRFRATLEKPFEVPARHFYGLMRKWLREGRLEMSYGKFSIKECDEGSRYLLTYKGRSIKLWQVTWHYIVGVAEWHLLSEKERIRRIKVRENL